MEFDRPTLRQRFRHITGQPVDFDLRPFRDLVAELAALEPEVERLDDAVFEAGRKSFGMAILMVYSSRFWRWCEKLQNDASASAPTTSRSDAASQ